MTEINETLQKIVGLEKLYPWVLEDGLTFEGREVSGCYMEGGYDDFIIINSQLSAKKRILTYLHEAAHKVASPYLAKLDTSGTHNQFFATLVAVMYRRIDNFEFVQIYDFCDTDEGQSFHRELDSRQCSNEELIRRFNFIVEESSRYASTTLSIEKIADYLWLSHPPEKWKEQVPDKEVISDLALGAIGGGLLTASVLVSAIWLTYLVQSSDLLKSLFA